MEQLKSGSADSFKTAGGKETQVEVSSEIADQLLELRAQAKAVELKYLVYFLEMAFQEAFTQANRDPENIETKPD